MTSLSSSSSTSSSSSEASTPLSLSTFDPFATHAFTNCSAVQDSADPPNRGYPYPFRPPVANFTLSHPSQAHTATNHGLTSVPQPYTPAINAFPPKGANIFVTYRQETPSPDLEDILKSSKSKTSSPSCSPSRSSPRSNSPAKHPYPQKS